ncbi:MAG: FHA domain-containing protein [Mobilicoccus sp.]|nr:FHA domain-containing protein [Mobilicoccus sp.]
MNRPPSREVAGDWVVEVWIDPAWYAVQEAMEACPSPAPPEVIPVRGSDALIGRRSRSSTPDIDCGVDAAVSRRQALLTSDGRRWWVEDLDSSNGTWVGPAIGPLPIEPISARTEIDADDRIYVGAWTRLVLRPATPGDL